MPVTLDAVHESDDAAVLAFLGVGTCPAMAEIGRRRSITDRDPFAVPGGLRNRRGTRAPSGEVQDDEEHGNDDPDAAPADRHPAPERPASPVLDLRGVEPGPLSEHARMITTPTAPPSPPPPPATPRPSDRPRRSSICVGSSRALFRNMPG